MIDIRDRFLGDTPVSATTVSARCITLAARPRLIQLVYRSGRYDHRSNQVGAEPFSILRISLAAELGMFDDHLLDQESRNLPVMIKALHHGHPARFSLGSR